MQLICRCCTESKDEDCFARRANSATGRQRVCKACNTTRVREWRRSQPQDLRSARVKNDNLRKYYGVTLADYNRMKAAQGGKCGICGTSEPGGRGDFHVDHCHHSGAVRGLLCHACNVGIGNMRDSPDLLEAAAAYLRFHAKERAA
jgi:hypothetical protein